MNTEELQEITKSIKTILQNKVEGLRFVKLFDKLNENREKNRITKHKFTQAINHLKQEGWISLQNYNLVWNTSQQVHYTPTIAHIHDKLEITLKPKISPSVMTIILANNLDIPLNSYHWYWRTPKPQEWEDFNAHFKFILDNKEYELPSKKDQVFFLEKPTPYYYDFRIDFPVPLFKNKIATIELRRNRYYDYENDNTAIYPDAPNQRITFILNCPSPDFQLLVWQINKETAQKTYSHIQPSQKGNKITWENTSHNLEYYYQFEWNKFT